MRGSQFIKKLLRDNRGATAIEYGLIVSLIVIAIIVALQGVATANSDLWSKVTSKVSSAM
jgi:pilus assembly protein Flp/PilA